MSIALAKTVGFNFAGVGPEGYVKIHQQAWAEAELLFAQLAGQGLEDNLVYGAVPLTIATDHQIGPGDSMLAVVTASVAGLTVRLPVANQVDLELVLGKPWQIANDGAEAFDVALSDGTVILPALLPGETANCIPFDNASAPGAWSFSRWAKVVAAVSGNQNRTINGVGDHLNERGAVVGLVDNDFVANRFRWGQSGAGVLNGAVADFNGRRYMTATVTTADASIGAADFYSVNHRYLGSDLFDFRLGMSDAVVAVLSFTHCHSQAGIRCVAFTNEAADRHYIAQYTQQVADAEERSVVIVPMDTLGVWNNGNGIGLRVDWTLAAGSNFEAAVGVWGAGAKYVSGNQVNGVGTIGEVFRLTDIDLRVGSVAPERLEFVPLWERLTSCALFAERIDLDSQADENLTGALANTTSNVRAILHYARKRAAPTVVATPANTFGAYYAQSSVPGTGNVTFAQTGRRTTRFTMDVASAALTQGEKIFVRRNGVAAAYVDVSAEL